MRQATRRLPVGIRADAEEVIGLTDGFCTQHLDEEYAALCAIQMLCRTRAD